MSTGRVLGRAVLAAGSTGAAWALLHSSADVRERLRRSNFRQEPVTLIEGPAIVAGLASGGLGNPAVALTALGAGGFGLLDDLAGSGARRGFKGHLTGLMRGEVTTGALKIVGIGGTAVLAAVLLDRGSVRPASTGAAAVLIAGGANLMNLFDLRPGRALKVAALVEIPLLVIDPAAAAAPLAASAVVARPDLAGRSMMGDTGANALGGVLAASWARRLGPAGRSIAAAAVVGLMLISERVSFSRVIDGNPVLRAVDGWGRVR